MKVEIPLLILMLCTGTGAGAGFLAAISEWVNYSEKSDRMKEAAKWGAYVAIPFTVIGLLASLLHLQRPALFLTGLTNIATSWLSREGATSIIFVVLLMIYAYLWFQEGKGKAASGNTKFVVSILMGVAAVVFIFSQSMIYASVKAIPAWNGPITVLVFMTSAATLGTLLVGTTLAIRYMMTKEEAGHGAILSALRPITSAGALLVVALIVFACLRWLNLALTPSPAAGKTLALLTGSLLGMNWVRIIIGLILPLLAMVYAWSKIKSQPEVAMNWIIASFGMVVVGEVLARELFFLAGIHI